MRWMALCFCLLFWKVGCGSATGATPKIFDSLEWLCLASDVILTGEITEVHDVRGGGKSRDLVWFVFRGRELRRPKEEKLFYLGVRLRNTLRLQRYKDKKERLLIFANTTFQAFRAGRGISVHTWPLWVSHTGRHWVVPLRASWPLLVSFGERRVLAEKSSVFPFCQQTTLRAQQALRPLLEKQAPKNGKKAWVEKKIRQLWREPYFYRLSYLRQRRVPLFASSKLHQKLGCQGGCFLKVPGLMFPAAKQKTPNQRTP